MSFQNCSVVLKFEATHNRASWASGGAQTYATDFDTGRSWVRPETFLRFYKDGAVSLHTNGRGRPLDRKRLMDYGIDVELLKNLRGKFFTADGKRVLRHHVNQTDGTVLVEGDRIYPLKYNSSPGGRSKSPLGRAMPSLDLQTPFVVWPSRDSMPLCCSVFEVTTPDKQAAQRWEAEHGEKLKVARTLGALQGATNTVTRTSIHHLKAIESVKLGETSVPDDLALALWNCPAKLLEMYITQHTSKTVEHEYLLYEPS